MKLGRTWVDRFQTPSSNPKAQRRASRLLLRGLGGRRVRRDTRGLDLLCVMTSCSRPDVIWSFSGPVISFVESWDHPYKPQHYDSGAAVAWNDFTAQMWKLLRGSPAVSAGFPLKLTYALNAARRGSRAAARPRPTWMYAMTLSSLYRDPSAFHEELRLIGMLGKKIRVLGADLVVKAKPNQDLKELAKRSELAGVALLPESRESVVGDYFLSETYNAGRRQQLSEVDGVIALGTTFLFDAAVADCPVLYLDAASSEEFPALKAMTLRSQHIGQCLHATGIDGVDLDMFASALGGSLADTTQSANSDSQKLRSWLADGEVSRLDDGDEHLRVASAVRRAAERE